MSDELDEEDLLAAELAVLLEPHLIATGSEAILDVDAILADERYSTVQIELICTFLASMISDGAATTVSMSGDELMVLRGQGNENRPSVMNQVAGGLDADS